MKYLQQQDYEAYIQNRFFAESQSDNPLAFETIETQVVAEVADRLSGRYNTAKIFDPEKPIRSELLAKIITKIAIYELIRRNAARKVPQDYVNDWEWAQKMLDKLESGTPKLPLPTTENGGNLMFGNNTNTDFFI